MLNHIKYQCLKLIARTLYFGGHLISIGFVMVSNDEDTNKIRSFLSDALYKMYNYLLFNSMSMNEKHGLSLWHTQVHDCITLEEFLSFLGNDSVYDCKVYKYDGKTEFKLIPKKFDIKRKHMSNFCVSYRVNGNNLTKIS